MGTATGVGGAPKAAEYILATANVQLPNAQALASLATGLVKNTTGTGVLSIATAADIPLDNAIILLPTTSLRNVIQPTTDVVPFTVKGPTVGNVPSPASALAIVQNDAGTATWKVGAAGGVIQQLPSNTNSLGTNQITDGDFTVDPTSTWTFSGAWSWNSGTHKMGYAGVSGPVGIVLINYGGTGYTAGDVLTLTNGANDATITVSTVSSGVITAVTITNAGTACTTNTNVAVTGGTGTGATFTIFQIADSAATLSQTINNLAAGNYLITFTTSARTTGAVKVTMNSVVSPYWSTNTTNARFFVNVATQANITVTFTPTANWNGSITNILVQKIIPVTPLIQYQDASGNEISAFRSAGSFPFTVPSASHIGLGLNAGAALASDAYTSVIIGDQAGEATVGAGNAGLNVFVGALVGQFSDGQSNTAVGFAAGQYMISGSGNTLLGIQAGQNLTLGSNNVFVGGASGLSTANAPGTGSNNVGVGRASLQSITNGASNVAVGASSGVFISSGLSNTLVGATSGNALTTGSSNVLLGVSAASALKTGSSNVIIGNSAGGALLTGSNNVFIGPSAGSLEVGSSKLYIHFSNVLAPLIYGDFGASIAAIGGSLGVRTQNPQASLDVLSANAVASNYAIEAKQTGAQLITASGDQTFAGGNNWTGTNWTTSANKFVHTTGNTADAVLANANLTTGSIQTGRSYKVVFTISSRTAGTLTAKIGVATSSAQSVNTTFTVYITATANNANLIFTPTTDFDGSLSAVTITALSDVLILSNAGNLGIGGVVGAPNQLLELAYGHLRFDTVTAPTAPTAALAGAGAGNVDNGTHIYKVTFVTGNGETELGTASGTVTVADKTVNGQVSLTAIPVGTTTVAGLVTSRKIYRTKAGGSAYFLLTTIADNTTTTFTDNVADASLDATDVTNQDNFTAGKLFVNGTLAGFLGSAFSNTVFGVGSYSASASNAKNAIFGTLVAPGITTAQANSMFGHAAGNAITSGSFNAFFGTNAGSQDLVGSNNVCVGYFSGQKITGGNSTIVGFQAGVTNTGANAVTTGHDVTLIGANTGPNSSTQRNFSIAIGSGAVYGADSVAVIGTATAGGSSSDVNLGVGTVAPLARGHFVLNDTGTNAVTDVMILSHDSNGSIVANFGTALEFQGQDSTTADQSMGRVRTLWTTATHASRKARAVFSAYDTAERDCLAIEASGTAAMIGFLGTAPIIKITTGVAAAAFVANSGTAVNDASTFGGYTIKQIAQALQNYGLLT